MAQPNGGKADRSGSSSGRRPAGSQSGSRSSSAAGGAKPGRQGSRPGGAGSSRGDGPRGATRGAPDATAERKSPGAARPIRPNPAPPKPELPDDEPQLPKSVRREIDRVIGDRQRARDIALALSVASEAIDEGYVELAVNTLAWARHEAARVASIREAYGVALYLAEDYGKAITELQAYRRMTGRNDQNHLIADCERGRGREIDKIAAAVEEMLKDADVEVERKAEGVIVWASALADRNKIAEGRAVLRRFAAHHSVTDEDTEARVNYVAADLAERDGDRRAARESFRALADIDAGFADVTERLRRLEATE